MGRHTTQFKVAATAVMVYAVLVACSTLREFGRSAKPNRGVVVNHDFHAQEGLDCSDCHEFASNQRASFAGHDTCSICHEIPEDTIGDVSCALCHTRPDYSVAAKLVVLTDEIKFDHLVHASAKVSCAECHADPDRPPLRAGQLKPLCMECHSQPGLAFASTADSGLAEADFRANECSVCHRDLDVDTVPQFRRGVRLAHDSPHVWERVHGMESQVDPMFCGQCHDDQDDCATCHRITEPASHTASWNRKLHGLQASWDMRSCSVCHEEDSCVECHRNTQPVSHRGSFDSPQNSHCVQCHFPPENNCVICHEAIDHRSAPRSPHDAGGGFAGDCSECHPGGLAGAVPHFLNLTTSCRSCHR